MHTLLSSIKKKKKKKKYCSCMRACIHASFSSVPFCMHAFSFVITLVIIYVPVHMQAFALFFFWCYFNVYMHFFLTLFLFHFFFVHAFSSFHISSNVQFLHACISFLSPAFSKKSGGTLFLVFRGAWRVVRGAWFRVFSRYFVPLTPPTVFVRSFWNFTGVLRMVWRFACGFFRILK